MIYLIKKGVGKWCINCAAPSLDKEIQKLFGVPLKVLKGQGYIVTKLAWATAKDLPVAAYKERE